MQPGPLSRRPYVSKEQTTLCVYLKFVGDGILIELLGFLDIHRPVFI
jgi:hypothetical protein